MPYTYTELSDFFITCFFREEHLNSALKALYVLLLYNKYSIDTTQNLSSITPRYSIFSQWIQITRNELLVSDWPVSVY